ncbi:MAG: DUF4430 domain-containing protein [Clostridia bacterium]|nr:DUF4430 domain-containing protein [Clostridia bacterium]
MKRTIKQSIALILSLTFILFLASCSTDQEASNLWENATYQSDMQFGEGSKTVVVEVIAEEKTITFTIKTDKSIVGDALTDHGLISGEEGPYGLYIKSVNGITADYDVDQAYWAFNINGEYAMTGVDTTEIAEGTTYQLVYTK